MKSIVFVVLVAFSPVAQASASGGFMLTSVNPAASRATPLVLAQTVLAQTVEPKADAPAREDEPEEQPAGDDAPSPRTVALAKVALASVLVGKCDTVEFLDEPLATFFVRNIGELDSETNDLLSALAFAASTVLGDKSGREICDEAIEKFGPEGSEAKGLITRK